MSNSFNNSRRGFVRRALGTLWQYGMTVSQYRRALEKYDAYRERESKRRSRLK